MNPEWTIYEKKSYYTLVRIKNIYTQIKKESLCHCKKPTQL